MRTINDELRRTRGGSMIRTVRTRSIRSTLIGTAALLAVLAAACDTDVVNPGRVDDSALSTPLGLAVVVNGIGMDLATAMNWVSYTGGAVSRELHPAGSTGSYGISPLQQVGLLIFDDLHVNPAWETAQRARWVGENGTDRVKSVLEGAAGSSPLLAQALVWAGYANRLLGENMCEAVIDGGGRQPRQVFLERAEGLFTEAITVAGAANRPQLATAARAGRAAVRMHLGDWAGAVADAGTIPTDFVYTMPYYDIGFDWQYNRIHFASANAPYRAHTVWNTVYEEYFAETGDPRTPYRTSELVGDAAVSTLGRVPWYPQEKHGTRDSPIRLSSGREMRLIEAERMLRDGDWQGAMTVINDLRASVGVDPWPANGLEEAWTRLKRERGIELWLEGRRLGDLNRWIHANTPGEFHPLEIEGGQLPLRPLSERTYCFPIPLAELETNPNL